MTASATTELIASRSKWPPSTYAGTLPAKSNGTGGTGFTGGAGATSVARPRW